MRIVDVRERTVPLSRYEDPAIPSGGLDTSVVAVRIDAASGPKVGYGFASIGRFGQHGLISDRFAPRLLNAVREDLVDESGELDPVRAWRVLMAGEKVGGHGERCVAVGALDMALWDLAAKRAGLPLATLLARRLGDGVAADLVPLYASGGYRYPSDDERRLRDEVLRMRADGYDRVKIKIGGAALRVDLRRITIAQEHLPSGHLAVDAMNAYDADSALVAAEALSPLGLWWFEDVCDPHDFRTQRAVTDRYSGRIAAGEPLFSWQEAALLADHGGLRPDRDILLFDPAHCYGVTGFARIVATMVDRGWKRDAFWPHGGHLFTLHVAAGLRLGGTEVNPFSFAPFGGLRDGDRVASGAARVSSEPGIGFEQRDALRTLFGGLAA